jgi:hypothetical protein
MSQIEEAVPRGVPVVLVHGNPETDVVWDLLVARLVESGLDEPVRLSPPGFGARCPTGSARPLPSTLRG